MSRCVIKTTKADHYLVVGFDPPMQSYFLQLYDERVEEGTSGDKPCGRCGRMLIGEPGCECPEVAFWIPEVRSNGALLKAMQDQSVDLTDPYTQKVYDCIAMDLDPGKVPRP